MLKATFRGADAAARMGKETFLVIMPDTNRSQAKWAIRRLAAAVEVWNSTTDFQYKLALNLGISVYVTGSNINGAVEEAMQRFVNDADTGAMLLPLVEKTTHEAAK